MSETTNEAVNPASPQPPHVARPLPSTLNIDGRPVWEPPIFNYTPWIGEEYEKQREAVLKYYNGDVVKTTKFFDLDVENDLLLDYEDWVFENHEDGEGESFWRGLVGELIFDTVEVQEELGRLKTVLVLREDGTYFVRAADGSEYSVAEEDNLSLRDDGRGDDGAVEEEEEISSSHPSEHMPESERQAMGNINETTCALLGAQIENDSSQLFERRPRMEEHPVENAHETSPLLSTPPTNDAVQAWSVCGCLCS